MSPPLSVTPCSACSVLSTSLLACLHDFTHVPRWANLENVAIRQRRMLANELYSMIHVPRLENNNAAELLFGLGIGAVDRCHLAVLPREGQGGLRPLKRFATTPVPVGAKMIVIFKACVEHGVSRARLHAIEFAFVVVAKTDVFHCSSPLHRRTAWPVFDEARRVFLLLAQLPRDVVAEPLLDFLLGLGIEVGCVK